jgi:stage III sporulation protein AD
MEVMKVIILGILICFLSVLLKQIKPEYSIIAIVVGGIILVLYIVNSLINVFSFFSDVVNKTGIDGDLFLLLVKIIGIGYLIEFAVGVCNDSGHSSIGDKIVIAGKIMIFIISMPIITNLFNLILDLL